MRVLFISYDGMTDPLGQSQVIPYLSALSEAGVEFHILSAEKQNAFQSGKKHITSVLDKSNIHWHTVTYTKKPPVISTIQDIGKLKRRAHSLHRHYQFDMCHCRSYIAAFAGLQLKRQDGVPFLFDMRGFFPDERVDGGLWNMKNPLYNLVYSYFKKREKAFLREANHVISLTESGKEVLCLRQDVSISSENITVIPCCADMNHFDPGKVDVMQVEAFRKETGIEENDFVLSYLGSLGTWYMTDEMLDFYGVLLSKKPDAKFLIITKDDTPPLVKKAKERDLPVDQMVFRPAERAELPALISLSTVSVFFIKPVFSKKASSPTKLAELLAMGVPVICNAGVGDIDRIVKKYNTGLVLHNMNDENYCRAVERIDELRKYNVQQLRKIAMEMFSLSKGVNNYFGVYKDITQ